MDDYVAFCEDHLPASLEEATSRRRLLVEEISAINIQLGDRNRIDPASGRRLSHEEFFQWRTRALCAKAAKESELQFLKEWITHQHNVQKRVGRDRCKKLLHEAHRVLARLQGAGQITSPAELDVLRDIEVYLDKELVS
ncbi:MAG: hypothetical protein PHR51_02695 [Patescibacteria group bacterium]|nr:hypothetical protein [Patescibacteria group bacterium]